jgi:hypothetical protein
VIAAIEPSRRRRSAPRRKETLTISARFEQLTHAGGARPSRAQRRKEQDYVSGPTGGLTREANAGSSSGGVPGGLGRRAFRNGLRRARVVGARLAFAVPSASRAGGRSEIAGRPRASDAGQVNFSDGRVSRRVSSSLHCHKVSCFPPSQRFSFVERVHQWPLDRVSLHT